MCLRRIRTLCIGILIAIIFSAITVSAANENVLISLKPKVVPEGGMIKVTGSFGKIKIVTIDDIEVQHKKAALPKEIPPELKLSDGTTMQSIEILIMTGISIAGEIPEEPKKRNLIITNDKGKRFPSSFFHTPPKPPEPKARLVISPKAVVSGDSLIISGILGTTIKNVRIDKTGTPFDRILLTDEKTKSDVSFVETTSSGTTVGKAVQVVFDKPSDDKNVQWTAYVETEKGWYSGGFNQYSWSRVMESSFLPIIIIIVLFVFFKKYGSMVFKSKTGEWSLSKIQMAGWTLIFGISYVVLSSFWGHFLDITEGMFWLMGISATTAAGAMAIAVRNQGIPTRAQQIAWEVVKNARLVGNTSASAGEIQKAADTVISNAELVNKIIANDDLMKVITAQRSVIDDPSRTQGDRSVAALEIAEAVVEVAPPPSKLLRDWDKDKMDYVISLHRSQIALWTLIVMMFYMKELFTTLHIPEIPNNLIVLMGISGGTYLGFKFPSK